MPGTVWTSPKVESASPMTDVGPIPNEPLVAPDVGIISPLAATSALGAIPAWDFLPSAKPLQPTEPAEPKHFLLPRPTAADDLVPPPTATNDPAPSAVPTVGLAADARSTADRLRSLTRRVPGAALEQEDGSLRRATPTSTTRNPLGVAGALSQYLSATSNDGRPDKAEGPEKEQDVR